ncbi:MAG: hypothetical protein ACK4M9_06065 [Anaerobacillus sp.]|uniref:hypothetical protein n=1 Tax=Anaerobacillus sp. TaxID=1872506 RepID=UPI00391DA9B9
MKRKIGKIMISLLVFLFIFTFLPLKGFACSCEEPKSPLEELKDSSAVFSGRVIGIVDENKGKELLSGDDPIRVLFEVNET